MAKLPIVGFGGIRPRFSRRAGNEQMASMAQNVKLWHGTLAPWRMPLEVLDANECFSTFVIKGCCVLGDVNPCASFAFGQDDCNRVYATDLCGEECPMTAVMPACSGEMTSVLPNWVKLGVPTPDPLTFTVPALTPAVVLPGINVGEQYKREQRDYVYTYVNSFGEEGPPSHPSPSATDADADAVALLTIPLPPAGWDVVSMRIYRVQSGAVSGEFDVESTYLFVDEVPVGTTSYVDSVPVSELAEPVTLTCTSPPPCGLKQITMMENGGLFGFEDRKIWFSEPFEYHNWGCYLELDHEIKGVKEVAGSIYVATVANPYVVSSVAPEGDCTCCRSVFKHPEPMPMVSDFRGMVATPNGVMWPTDDGLVRMTGQAVTLVSHQDWAEDDWAELFPNSFKAVNWNGRYMGFGVAGGLVFDYTDGIYADGDVGFNSNSTTLTYRPNAVATDERGHPYMAFGNKIYKWDASDEFEVYRWRSALRGNAAEINWAAAKIAFERSCRQHAVGNPVLFTLYDDCGDAVYSLKVGIEKPFWFPPHFRGRVMSVSIEGTTEVQAVYVATSIRELA